MAEPRPSLGRIVLVRTPGRFSGQDENAAIVTSVAGDGAAISVTLFPPDGGPVQFRDIYPTDHPYAGPTAWRWPPRS